MTLIVEPSRFRSWVGAAATTSDRLSSVTSVVTSGSDAGRLLDAFHRLDCRLFDA